MVATTADATAARTWVEDGATSRTAALLKNRLYRHWGIKTAREYARIKIDGLQLVGGNPDFTNAPRAGPGTATTTHASTTGSKPTYTPAGDSSPAPYR